MKTTKIEPFDLSGHTDEYERQAERLIVENANLRAENRTLRRRLPESTGDVRRLRQAHRDAKAMILHRFSGYSISRSSCLALGISRRRWSIARALLQVARVYAGNDIVIEYFDTAIKMLDDTFASMQEAGNAQRLKMRLPASLMWRSRSQIRSRGRSRIR